MAQEFLLPAPGHSPPSHRDFLPLHALQDALGTEQVPAALHGLAAGQLWWKRQALPQAGGTDPRVFSSPTPLGDNHPKETQLLVTISENTPRTAALCKKERPQDKRFILLLPLNRPGHFLRFAGCQSLGAALPWAAGAWAGRLS